MYLYIEITLFLVYYNINKGTENKLIKKESEDLNMKKTLYELFMGCNWNACRVPWRIYGENNKLICKNYSAETSDEFDNMQVKSYSYSKKKDYVRVYVK